MVDRDVMSGLAKGLAVIEAFTAERPRLSISEAALAAGLDRATARRCLLTLARLGYADHDGKFFTLKPRVLRLGLGCLAAMPLPQLAQPLLDRLSAQTSESSSASVLDGPDIVYVARAAQRKVMSIALMPGSRLPAFCTSMGRVMLAALPEEEVRQRLSSRPLAARTPRTITDIGLILDELSRARRKGYAVVDQEVELGLRSIAVPVLNVHGRTVGAVNIGVSATHAQAADLVPAFLAQLLEVQRELRLVTR